MASEQVEELAAPAVNQCGSGLTPWGDLPRRERWRVAGCVGYLVLLTLAFIQPLTRLALYSAQSELNSYILLVPFIVGYLFYIQRASVLTACRSSIVETVIACGIGFAALTAEIVWRPSLSINDDLSLVAVSFVSFTVAGVFGFFGAKWMAAQAFPVAFLSFIVPLPDAWVNELQNVSVIASAGTATLFFDVVGTPVTREGTVLQLPDIALQVARECSGIHSSWILFIVGLLASHLFLKTAWSRIALVGFVIPLGIMRNGFRIFVIGQLCVSIGPHMIGSRIHHQGGPIFFALSMIPLLLLLLWLRRRESLRVSPPC